MTSHLFLQQLEEMLYSPWNNAPVLLVVEALLNRLRTQHGMRLPAARLTVCEHSSIIAFYAALHDSLACRDKHLFLEYQIHAQNS